MDSNKRNNTKSFIWPILSLAIVSIVLVSSINTYVNISILENNMNKDIENYKNEYLQKNKNDIYNRVHSVEESIKFQSEKIESKVRKALKDRIETALSIAQFVYSEEKGKFSVSELKQRIAHYLSAITFNEGRGYYFSYDNATNVILGHAIKKLVTKDMTEFRDIKKQNLINLYAKKLKKDKIAFAKIYFKKPGDTKREFPKLVCVTKFEPLDMVIGTGEYLDVIEQETKKFILDRYSIDNWDKKDYILIYDVLSLNDTDMLATLILNPNNPELVGKKIDINDKDAKGNLFVKTILSDMIKKGESYIKYWHKQPNMTEIKSKMSYMYYDKNWNWIIRSEFNFDDLVASVESKQKAISSYTKKMVLETIKITILLSLIMIFFALLISVRIDRVIKSYIMKLSAQSLELKKLNESLEEQVIEKTKQNMKQMDILQQQSKMAQMGEMIGAIAHQWRQPLNVVSISIQNLLYDFEDGHLNNEKYINTFIEKNKKTIKFMSETIDDFRSFFRIDKVKKHFNVKDATQSIVDMQAIQLKNLDINLEINGEAFVCYGLQSEYLQVVLNLINNAKDALIEASTKNPMIHIVLHHNSICVQDNAGGVPIGIIDRVFDPYFTTKEQGKGTGMGLYISKMIIEENMGGTISVENKEDGACFCIDFGLEAESCR